MNSPASPDRPSFAVPAATVLLMSKDHEPRVLMMRRHESLNFLGGFWVFPGGTVDAVDAKDGSHEVHVAAVAACRELAEETDMSLPVSALVHWAHWITPSALRRRFDTHFFVAATAETQPKIASPESSELRWVEPRDWHLAAHKQDFPLTPPTVVVLRELDEALARYGSVAALLAAARRRTVRTILPKLMEFELAVLPWDPDYNALPGTGVAWDQVGIDEKAGWPSRFPTAIGRPPSAG